MKTNLAPGSGVNIARSQAAHLARESIAVEYFGAPTLTFGQIASRTCSDVTTPDVGDQKLPDSLFRTGYDQVGRLRVVGAGNRDRYRPRPLFGATW